MHNITFIGTVHEEHGRCNAKELCSILGTIKPDVLFLEALDITYSNYEHMLYKNWGVFHKKLEIKALQLYNFEAKYKYIPVLNFGMPKAFQEKGDLICLNAEIQNYCNLIHLNVGKYGFKYLNGKEIFETYHQIQTISRSIVSEEIEANSNKAIDDYENNMLNNIYEYCKGNNFEKGVFLCGAAHKKSMMTKFVEYNHKEEIQLNWNFIEFN